MSIVVEITNPANLNKAKDLLGAKNESETLELALEIVIRDFEQKQETTDLPDNYFEDLFNENTVLADCESIQAVLDERGESRF